MKEELLTLKKMIDALPIMAWVASAEGKDTIYNNKWFQYFGKATESWTQEQWALLMHPEDVKRTITLWSHSLATGSPYHMIMRWKSDAEAPYRWFDVQAKLVNNEAGRAYYWMGTTIDIHDQKIAHQELEKSLTDFQFLSDMVPHLVWRTDPKGYHDYFNQQWVDYTGYSVADSLGTDMWNKLLHPEDQQRARQVWNHCLATGEPYQIEYRFKRASDGMWRWFLARALPLRDRKGHIINWYGTCTDIHEHKQLLDALSQARKELHATNGELEVKNGQLNRINMDLDTIVYAASHDLKSPVNNLEGLLGVLKKHAKEAEQVKIISMMEKSIVRLKSTMAELTQIISVQNPNDELPDLVSFESLFKEIKDDLVELIESTNTTIREDFRVDHVMYPRKYLRSIIFNLLTNAIKYRSSQRSPLIYVSTFSQADNVVMQVSDNGSGMGEKDLARLFEIFRRFHENVDGTGVGLYLIKKMLDNTGGSIKVSSEVGKGTTFDVFIPIRSVIWPEPVS